MKQRVIFQAKPARDEPYTPTLHCKCSVNVWLTHLSQDCAVNPHYSRIVYLWIFLLTKIYLELQNKSGTFMVIYKHVYEETEA